MRLFVGDDWAEDHHDVELMDERGRVLARGRLPEGVAGIARLHELIGEQLGEGADDAEVVIGTGTDRGPWVGALVAAGYTVYGVNPLQASRYRERQGDSGAKSGCGTSCGSTSPPRWRPSPTWTRPTRWSCWARHRTRRRPRS